MLGTVSYVRKATHRAFLSGMSPFLKKTWQCGISFQLSVFAFNDAMRNQQYKALF